MQRAPSRAVRAAVTAVVLAAVPAVGPCSAAVADDGAVSLPGVVSRLAADQPCVTESARTARAQPWTRQALGLSRTWQLTRGAGVTVAVVDTGVGADIPALSGRVRALGGAGEDCVGHGSFAAGLIAAAPSAGTGVAGVAPQARILAVRATDERGAATPASVAEAIRNAVDARADIVYVAQALPTGRAELSAAVDHATDNDVLMVAPATPDTAPLDPDTGRPDRRARPYFPAFVPQVLSVVDHGADGRRPDKAPDPFAPDLAAPGDAVVSVGPQGAGHYIGSGASLAAAHVAGAAALVRAYHPQMTAAQVARQLTASAYPASVPQLDPYAAVSAVLPGRSAPAPRPAPVRVAPAGTDTWRTRAVIIAGGFGALVLMVAAAGAVVPRGRARGWRPAGR
ncbi:S8 family serine peptidase [Streptomyces sp. NPDC001177]